MFTVTAEKKDGTFEELFAHKWARKAEERFDQVVEKRDPAYAVVALLHDGEIWSLCDFTRPATVKP
jgi:hypothetical protein